MKRKKAEQVGDVVLALLRQQGLEAPLNEYRLIQSWTDVMGPAVERYTRNVFIRNQTLFVQLASPVLRQELSMQKRELVQRLNSHARAQVITDITFM